MRINYKKINNLNYYKNFLWKCLIIYLIYIKKSITLI